MLRGSTIRPIGAADRRPTKKNRSSEKDLSFIRPFLARLSRDSVEPIYLIFECAEESVSPFFY